MNSDKILIFGAGSVGSFLAAKFVHSGCHVDVVGRKAERIGKFLYINDEKFNFPTVSSAINGGVKYDYIFLASKITDLKNNLNILSGSGIQSKTIVLIQNSFFDISEYRVNPEQSMTSVLVYDGFNLIDNQLNYAKGGGFFIEVDQNNEDLYLLIKKSDIKITKIDDIIRQRAEKAICNCSINIFSAIYSKSFKELFEDDLVVKRIENVFNESYEVLSRKVVINRDRKALWYNFSRVVKTMNHHASTSQDIKMGKLTELAFLNGSVIQLGKEMGIATPHNIEIVNEFRSKHPELY